jgi:hypothetical protein
LPCRIAVHGIETVLARVCPALPAHEARIVKLAHTAPPPRAAPSALTLRARRSSNCSFCIKIKPDLSRFAGHADTLYCSSPSAPLLLLQKGALSFCSTNGFFGRPGILAVLFLTAFALSSQRLTQSRNGRGRGEEPLSARCCDDDALHARKGMLHHSSVLPDQAHDGPKMPASVFGRNPRASPSPPRRTLFPWGVWIAGADRGTKLEGNVTSDSLSL